MIVATRTSAEPLATQGRERLGGVDVFWRLGSTRARTQAEVSRIARAWAHELVDDHGLFPWRGLERDHRWALPHPVGVPKADVSVSHSRGLVLAAVCAAGRIGADVEAAPFDAFDAPALRRRMCTLREHENASALPPHERRPYLARLWTAKEAVSKATGEGLGRDFRGLEVPAALHAPAAAFEAHLAVLIPDGPLTLRLTT